MTNDYKDLDYPTHMCDRAERDDRLTAHAERLAQAKLLAHNGTVTRPHHRDIILSKRGVFVCILVVAIVFAVGVRIGGGM